MIRKNSLEEMIGYSLFADDHTDRDDVESTERKGEFILNEEVEGEVVGGVIYDDDDDDDGDWRSSQ